jgi:Tfp pilus assembly protein PilF/2-polyprenyl-3-methyl-5-hydroxy-6-metoxy-1,4-benzoquinol methylase
MGSNPILSATPPRNVRSMNRKQRRASQSRGAGGGSSGAADALFAQALRHHQLGQWFEAEAMCRAILERESKHVGSLHLLGVLAQSRGAHDEAAARFRSVIALKPDIAAVHYGLGRSLAEGGRIEDAAAAFERARTLDAAARPVAGPQPDYARTYVNLGNLAMERGQPAQAADLYQRALSLRPDLAEAHNNLGATLLAQGKLSEAAARFVRALELAPELVDLFANLTGTLYRLNPALGEGVRRAVAAWPALPLEQSLLGTDGMAVLAGDVLLRRVLELITVRDMDLERFLTALRSALLTRAMSDSADETAVLLVGCALARQCFINEYVFAIGAEEQVNAGLLRERLNQALAGDRDVPALWLVGSACYAPLHGLANPQALLNRAWPEPVAALVTEQVREVLAERQQRDGIPHLTPIVDATSQKVREQYEENPYPRWVVAPAGLPPRSLEQHVRQKFPTAPIRPPGGGADILIAGCGSGQNSIAVARNIAASRVLAIDLSLASLSYARRKTLELGLANIEYAQADILALGSLGRSFDLVDASGVLHHLADPMTGWRILHSLVRPNGFMRIGLYSELARRDVVAAQRFASERGYRAAPDDIRRLRHALMDTPLRTVAKFHDFFSMSECRDLLFHVQEHRHTVAQIQSFVRAENLSFIGFEIDGARQQAYRAAFPRDLSMTNLDHWQAFEAEHPDTFAGMYQFWLQRA